MIKAWHMVWIDADDALEARICLEGNCFSEFTHHIFGLEGNCFSVFLEFFLSISSVYLITPFLSVYLEFFKHNFKGRVA